MQWVVSEQPDRDEVNHLTSMLGVPKIVTRLLLNRGIKTIEEARRFFKPDWEDLYDPYLMQDMDRAVDRVVRALEKKERFFIYGDYDVDGITGVSLLTLFFREMGNDVFYYIPDRLREGYGLSKSGIQHAAKLGAELIISVDCGITACREVDFANQMGIDVIISDHHEPSNRLPKAVAILNPKRKNCSYPFKELAGVGVAFKLVEAVIRRLSLDEEIVRQYVDLVALGSAADIVPLIDENRLLVKKGLERINRLDRLGIRTLAESAGLGGKKIGTGQIVFILAPRINAVGRLGDAERAVRLMITDSEQQARNIANILESENRNRKDIDENTFKEALEMIETEFDEQNDRAVVLMREGWHPGIIGIVASRIVEHLHRPTVMIAVENGVGKGSARSIANFDIYSALKTCESHLIDFGGHRYAAGLTIEVSQVEPFRKAFQEVASEKLTDEDLAKKLWIDEKIALSDISDKIIRLLNQFAPFGPKNMRPVFLSQNLQIVGNPKIVGKNHLKFMVRQNGDIFDAIGFNLGSLHYRLSPGEGNLDMIYVVEENYWNGKLKTQLRVKDLK